MTSTSKEVTTAKRKPPNAGKGRKPGVPNKTTALLKDAILLAAKKAGGDGDNGLVEYLQAQATANPGPFMSLLGKVLPMQITTDPNGEAFRVEMVIIDPAAPDKG